MAVDPEEGKPRDEEGITVRVVEGSTVAVTVVMGEGNAQHGEKLNKKTYTTIRWKKKGREGGGRRSGGRGGGEECVRCTVAT